MSEVRGSGQEELPHIRGRGSSQECQAAMVQEWPRGATPRLRSGAVAERRNPMSKEWWLCQAQEGLEGLFHAQGQEGRW